QLEGRPANGYVRPAVNRNVRFVAPHILEVEALSEELLGEGARPVEFLFELFLIVPSSVKRGRRAQAAEVRMAADMVPMRVGNEHGRQRRQSRRMRSQRFVCVFRGIRPRARVNAYEFAPIFGNHEIVFREFEAGQREDAPGNDLGDASWGKLMPGYRLLGE